MHCGGVITRTIQAPAHRPGEASGPNQLALPGVHADAVGRQQSSNRSPQAQPECVRVLPRHHEQPQNLKVSVGFMMLTATVIGYTVVVTGTAWASNMRGDECGHHVFVL